MDSKENKNHLSLVLKEALSTIKILKDKNAAHTSEPIAVIGMACRFPGGCNTPEKFWEFLKKGGDGIKEVPADRFNIDDYYDPDPNSPGKMYIREAGFLNEDISAFDAHFFQISPHEANDLDPQQRLLLELSWEAIERAGIAPNSLKESRTGVFIGLIVSEYGFFQPRNQESIGPYTVTGVLPNLASGRISHFFGFHGPAITIDTACSSSLVSTHLACESLQRKECDIALAGGVGIMIAPSVFVMLSKMKALAKDGRCKTFDASADGYGRGEGGGILVLKRLSDALKNNDSILAVIKGSAINQDGPSSGLTVPNGMAQQEVIIEALKKAGLNSADIGYFEAHGTGTALGDPIETHAISEVYAKNPRQDPLYIGTVKANIGHLEAAAGVAAIIKSILCLQNKMIPKHLHLKNLNPRINLEKIPAVIPQSTISWDTGEKQKNIAISSFGFSGTNAHLILSEPLQSVEKPKLAYTDALTDALTDEGHILTLSAQSSQALKILAEQFFKYSLRIPAKTRLADICYTANTGRKHFQSRAAFVVKDMEQLQQQLNIFLHTQATENVIFQNQLKIDYTPKIAFILSGEKIIDPEKYISLYNNYSIFQQAIDDCSKLFEPYLHYSLVDALVNNSQNTSAAHLFAIEYALAKLWMSWGVNPSIIIAEQLGIYVQACIAGVMHLEKAIQCLMEKQDVSLEPSDLSPPTISIISNDSGDLLKKSAALQPSYWINKSSAFLELKNTFQTLDKQNCSIYIVTEQETKIINDVMKHCGEKKISLIKGLTPENSIQNIAKLYCLGVNINWQQFYSNKEYTKLILPTYPFQRKQYWLQSYASTINELDKTKDPMQCYQIQSPLPQKLLEFNLSIETLPDLKDTNYVVHVGYYHEMFMNSVLAAFGTPHYTLFNFDVLVFLTVAAGKPKTISIILNPEKDNTTEIEMYARGNQSMPWVLYGKGAIKIENSIDLSYVKLPMREEFKKQCAEHYSGLEFYRDLKRRGVDLGESVRWIDEIWKKDYEAVIRFKSLNSAIASKSKTSLLPPGILDACAQTYYAGLPQELAKNTIFMVSKLDALSVAYQPNIKELWCHIRLTPSKTNAPPSAYFCLFDDKNRVIALCNYFEMRVINVSQTAPLQPKKKAKAIPTQVGHTEMLQKLKTISNDEQIKLLENYLRKTMAELLGLPEAELPIDESLRYLGMDSLVALSFVAKINSDFGVVISIDKIIAGPSITELVIELTGIINGA